MVVNQKKSAVSQIFSFVHYSANLILRNGSKYVVAMDINGENKNTVTNQNPSNSSDWVPKPISLHVTEMTLSLKLKYFI